MQINLPRPPSVNGLYASNWKTKRRFKSKKYAEWLVEAELAIQQQKPEPIMGFVHVEITVGKPTKRKEDISNRIKAVEDLLVSCGLIEDDSFIVCVMAMWNTGIKDCEVLVMSEDDLYGGFE